MLAKVQTFATLPPTWSGETFERFQNEVKSWDRTNKVTPDIKSRDVIESLKKNKDINENVINVVLDRTQEIGDKTVDKVLEILAEKYAKTTVEKSKDILKEILEFEMKED